MPLTAQANRWWLAEAKQLGLCRQHYLSELYDMWLIQTLVVQNLSLDILCYLQEGKSTVLEDMLRHTS